MSRNFIYWKCKLFGHKFDIQIYFHASSVNGGKPKLVFMDICQRKQCGLVREKFTGDVKIKDKESIHNKENITIELKG